MSDERRVELMALSGLKGAERNPKKHSADIGTSVGRFGFVEPIVVDERTGRIVAGHGRRDALLAMHAAKQAPPSGIAISEAGWLVPVLRGWSSRSDAEASAYLVASNKLVEAGGWDDGLLERMMRDLGDFDATLIEGIGFDADEIARLLGNTGSDPDAVPAEPTEAECYVESGDLWLLGRHRLLCGDSTKGDDVGRLMDGKRAGLMNTDPPYGVAYANDDRPRPGVAMPRVANDNLSDEQLQAFLEACFRCATEVLHPNAAWYLWHAQLTQGYFAAAAAAAACVVLHRQIIWVKPVLLFGRGQYHWKHELAFMGWVKGNQPPDYGRGNGERDQTTVWEISSVSRSERKEFNHSTPKPVGLFEIPIIKHLKRGEIAYEPFSGSAPQIIAAEKTGRCCYAMEVEPRYVQVAIERWQGFTGLKAAKEP